MKRRISVLFAWAILQFVSGCGDTPPAPPAPPTKSAAVSEPAPPPDPSLWAKKDLATALADHTAAAADFVKAAQQIKSGADVAANKPSVTLTAQVLRVTRYAVTDLARKTPMNDEQHKAFNAAAASVAEQVARLLDVPEAKKDLVDAFLLIRLSPSPK